MERGEVSLSASSGARRIHARYVAAEALPRAGKPTDVYLTIDGTRQPRLGIPLGLLSPADRRRLLAYLHFSNADAD